MLCNKKYDLSILIHVCHGEIMLLQYPIKNEKQTIVRPIAMKIAEDLSRYLEILPQNINIKYIDEEGVTVEKGSTLDELGEGIETQSNPLINITVSEEYQEYSLLQNQHYNLEFAPVFFHQDSNVQIVPYYSFTELHLTYSYKAQSKSAAKQWLNSVKSKIRRYNDTFPHNLSYHFEINQELIYVLSEVYKLVKVREPNIEPFSNWLQKHFIRRFGLASDVAGKNQMFVIKETQEQVPGYFNFDGMVEEGSKVDGATSWVVSFDYLVRYYKPTDVAIFYPRVIYNQVVPNTIMGVDTEGMPDKTVPTEEKFPEEAQYYTRSSGLLDAFSSIRFINHTEKYRGITVPYWNEFIPSQSGSIKGLNRFVDQLILFTPEDDVGCLIWDMNQPMEFTIDLNLLDFIISEGEYLVQYKESLFQLLLYQDNEIYPNALRVKDGKVYLNRPIDLKRTYNLRLGLFHDWRFVCPTAIERLKLWESKREDIHVKFITFLERYGYNHEIYHGDYSTLYFDIIDHLTMGSGGNNPNFNNHFGNYPTYRNVQKTVQIAHTTQLIQPKRLK